MMHPIPDIKIQNSKKFQVFLFLIIVLLCTSFNSSGDIRSDVRTAIENGNASKLAEHFANTLSLTVETRSGTYSNRQAKVILEKFFSDHPPRSFRIEGSGSVTGGGKYLLGSYSTNKGTDFTVYILWVVDKDVEKITRITFIKS